MTRDTIRKILSDPVAKQFMEENIHEYGDKLCQEDLFHGWVPSFAYTVKAPFGSLTVAGIKMTENRSRPLFWLKDSGLLSASINPFCP